MSRTIEPGVSLLTACEIRVVVLPIGPMPRDTFDSYLDVFNAHRHVPLNAARSFYQGGIKSPFSHLPYKTGAMHFRFTQADEARRRSRIVDLHQQRQVVAVLGLLHCPLVEDIMTAHSEFGRASKQWPEALVARCCAFEPSSAHLSSPGCKALTNLMIIPGGHIHQHLEVYMQEFAAAVLAAIEDQVLSASVNNVKTNTYVDSGDFLGSMVQIEEGLRNKLNLNEEEIKEKRRWGRFQKYKGDWALMAGSPRDAFEHYKSAMELSRAAGDSIWYGAAVEGVANARVLETLVASRSGASATTPASSSSSSSSTVKQRQPHSRFVQTAGFASAAAAAPADLPVAAMATTTEAAAGAAAAAAAAAAAEKQSVEHTSDAPVEPSTLSPLKEGELMPPQKDSSNLLASTTDAAVSDSFHSSSSSSSGIISSSSSSRGIFTLTSTELDISPSVAAAALSACVGVPEDIEGEEAAAAAAEKAEGEEHVDDFAAGGDGSSSSSKATGADATAADEARADKSPQTSSSSSSTQGFDPSDSSVAEPVDQSHAAAAAAAAEDEGDKATQSIAPQTPVRNSSSKTPTSTTSRPSSAAAAAAGSSAAHPSCPGYRLSGPKVWSVLAQADIEGEIRELMSEARNWYKRKGGALALQIEQLLKLCRFSAGLHGAAAARSEVSEAVTMITENITLLPLPEDRLTALSEAAQVLGLVGYGRKRLLLLWAAQDMFRSSSSSSSAGDKGSTNPATTAAAAPGDAAAMLRLALRSLMPPDQPRQQDADDLPRVHWSLLRFIAWQQQYISEQQSAAASSSVKSASTTAGPKKSGSGHRRRGSISSSIAPAAAAAAASSTGQQQQFYQLLGPQLQLLTSDQAAVLLQRLLVCDYNPQVSGSTPAECSSESQHFQDPAAAAAGGGDVIIGSASSDWICLWDNVLVAALESVVNVSRVANAPVEAWEAAATLLRECYVLLPQSVQVLLMETCAAAGSSLGSRARLRPGPGPGPQVQMKRILPGAPCLQPVHLTPAEVSSSSSSGGSGSGLRRSETGPFIFNPYAAKKKGATAAAAAAAALPEWVCNAECFVEVLLINPCAAPLRLDNLQLVVQQLSPQQQQQQQQDRVTSSSSSSSSQGAQVRGVSVSLAAGSKPVRVVLGYTPTQPGLAAITGIQASCWGVSWYQPFVHLPPVAAAAAGAGYEAVVPQGVFTVAVQPPLPLVKAVLHGPEVQLVQPSEDELAAAAAATSGSSSSSTSALSATWPGAVSAGGSSSTAATAASELDKKLPTISVHEGQALSWTLNLTNISDVPVTNWKVAVLNAKGVVVKPLTDIINTATHSLPPPAAAAVTPPQQQQQLPASFRGAHMEVQQSPASAGLPLLPGQSLSLPVSVTVGKPPDDAFDAVMLQLQITYCGSAASVLTAASSSSSSSSSSGDEGQVLGRRLIVPLKLSIQPTLEITGIRFLQQTLPYKDGVPADAHNNSPIKHIRLQHHQHQQQQQQQQASSDAALPRAAAAGMQSSSAMTVGHGNSGLPRRQQSRHVRNNSAGAVPVLTAGMDVSDMLHLTGGSPTYNNLNDTSDKNVGDFALSLKQKMEELDLSKQQQQQQQQQRETRDIAAAASPAAAAAGVRGGSSGYTRGHVVQSGAGGGSSSSSIVAGALSVRSEPVLELTVRNASERYFRAWLGYAPDQLSAESALSAVVVLEPGDSQKLTAVLPTAAAAAAVGTSPTKATKACLMTTAPPSADGMQGCCIGSSSSSSSRLCEPSRLHVSEGLVSRLVICWEMITGAAGASGHLPRGRVQLAAVDVAANITKDAVVALCPSPLTLRMSAMPAAAAAAAGPCQLLDLVKLAAEYFGCSGPGFTPGLCGPLWGLHMTAGQWLALDLEVTYAAARLVTSSSSGADGAQSDTAASSSSNDQKSTLVLQVSLSVTDLLSSSSSSGGCCGTQHLPTTPQAAAAGLDAYQNPQASLVDPGVFLTGCYNGLQVVVQPQGTAVQRFRALMVQPGLYQFAVADVVSLGGGEAARAGSAAAAAAAGSSGNVGGKAIVDQLGPHRVYYNQDRFYVLVTS